MVIIMTRVNKLSDILIYRTEENTITMATKTVCDICKKEIKEATYQSYVHEDVTHIEVKYNGLYEYDICSVQCLAQLAHNMRRKEEKAHE